jgi:resuscitation-promoting factor RpfB
LTLSQRSATERLTSPSVSRTDTVPVTKRTVSLVLAVGLAALLLGGCGNDQSSASPAKPAAQKIAEVLATSTPDDSAGDGAPLTDPADEVPSSPAKIIKKTVTEIKSIDYVTRTVKDSSLPKGKTKIRTNGKAGARTLTYQVTVTNGEQTAKKLLTSVVTRKPVTKVVAIGTKSAGGCDPNYSDACVPIASDVDCAGGGGNGPAFVQGPVRVVGSDIYDLDRDGDGVGCDD